MYDYCFHKVEVSEWKKKEGNAWILSKDCLISISAVFVKSLSRPLGWLQSINRSSGVDEDKWYFIKDNNWLDVWWVSSDCPAARRSGCDSSPGLNTITSALQPLPDVIASYLSEDYPHSNHKSQLMRQKAFSCQSAPLTTLLHTDKEALFSLSLLFKTERREICGIQHLCARHKTYVKCNDVCFIWKPPSAGSATYAKVESLSGLLNSRI